MRAFSAKVAGRVVMFSAASGGGGAEDEVEGVCDGFAASVDAGPSAVEKGFARAGFPEEDEDENGFVEANGFVEVDAVGLPPNRDAPTLFCV